MMDYVRTVFSKYADFTGRARRAEFWYFFLFCLLIGFVVRLFDDMLGLTFGDYDEYGVLGSLTNLVFLIPFYATGARRLHDTGRSGWWQLLVLTGIGIILLIIWWATEGETYPNIYGLDPKNPTNDDDIISHLID